MYLTKKQVTSQPAYHYGTEFISPSEPGWHTWVIPEDVTRFTMFAVGAGGGGINGTAGNGGHVGRRSSRTVEFNAGDIKSVSVYVPPVATPGQNGGTAYARLLPYIPVSGAEPGDESLLLAEVRGGAAGGSLAQDPTYGLGFGSIASEFDGELFELGQGGKPGQDGSPGAGGGGGKLGVTAGNGGPAKFKFVTNTSTRFSPSFSVALDSTFVGPGTISVKWPNDMRYMSFVIIPPGGGGQGGAVFSSGNCYGVNYWYTRTVDKQAINVAPTPVQSVLFSIPDSGKGGVPGTVGGMFPLPMVSYWGVPYDADFDTRASSSWITDFWTADYPRSLLHDGQTKSRPGSFTYEGRTFQFGVNNGDTPGRHGKGGGWPNGRGQDGGEGQVWWWFHN